MLSWMEVRLGMRKRKWEGSVEVDGKEVDDILGCTVDGTLWLESRGFGVLWSNWERRICGDPRHFRQLYLLDSYKVGTLSLRQRQ